MLHWDKTHIEVSTVYFQGSWLYIRGQILLDLSQSGIGSMMLGISYNQWKDSRTKCQELREAGELEPQPRPCPVQAR